MGEHSRIMSLASLMVALVFMMSGFINMAVAQAGVASCAQELIPCANYLNSTNPPSSCCDPLKKTVENELTCLCNLFFSPNFKDFNISVDQALQLSSRCGVTSGLSSCKAGSAPPPGSVPPPATPGGDNGGVGRATFAGLSFLLLFWASMMFN